jgi:hypothetical protein
VTRICTWDFRRNNCRLPYNIPQCSVVCCIMLLIHQRGADQAVDLKSTPLGE